MRLVYAGNRIKLVEISPEGFVLRIAYPTDTEKNDRTWRLWVPSDSKKEKE